MPGARISFALVTAPVALAVMACGGRDEATTTRSESWKALQSA